MRETAMAKKAESKPPKKLNPKKPTVVALGRPGVPAASEPEAKPVSPARAAWLAAVAAGDAAVQAYFEKKRRGN